MSTARMFDRPSLIEAFREIGASAVTNGTRIELTVYGGSAMLLASNFRFATEDVDIAEIGMPWPVWLDEVVSKIAQRNQWSNDWINEAVSFYLSPLASRAADHLEFGSYPPEGLLGLNVLVPTAEYLLALKLKAIRILDPVKGQQEADDIRNLMQVLSVDAEGAIRVLAKYFPRSAADSDKQRFLLKHMQATSREANPDAPTYGR